MFNLHNFYYNHNTVLHLSQQSNWSNLIYTIFYFHFFVLITVWIVFNALREPYNSFKYLRKLLSILIQLTLGISTLPICRRIRKVQNSVPIHYTRIYNFAYKSTFVSRHFAYLNMFFRSQTVFSLLNLKVWDELNKQ